MPDELPRKLPPKRAVDHEIKLVPGTKPPARASYRMSQPELVELRKQLKDMLESGPNQGGDEAKTTVVTRYGAFEFLVMPFGLMNALSTFNTMMNQVLHGFLDEFVVLYLDDIIVYSETLAEHVEHLCMF
ncbi:RNA-directed DNA polymerase [Sesamum angolense]|uniref:RNA-directed DNA polymerase n=1 Tax=Sesamum angolense TaxID=2727404 RepID=A0AAE1WJM0_9LAMI|nr:RNA-directed DNA polymerase [Sesamum angolense]